MSKPTNSGLRPIESHCLGKAANDNAKKVVRACEKHWEANKADCNKFLKAVAAELAINDFAGLGNADSIITFLEGSPNGWTKLPRGSHDAAHNKATEGNFVIAGLLSSDMSQTHGHVAVTTCGDKVHSGSDNIDYARGYWGTLGSVGKQCEGLNFAFPSPPRKQLRYYYHSVA